MSPYSLPAELILDLGQLRTSVLYRNFRERDMYSRCNI
jgi:hypothetical protein